MREGASVLKDLSEILARRAAWRELLPQLLSHPGSSQTGYSPVQAAAIREGESRVLPASGPPGGGSLSPPLPSLSPTASPGAVIDARDLFAARSRDGRMAAVQGEEVGFGGKVGHLETLPGPSVVSGPLRLRGQQLSLWYRVEAGRMRERLGRPPPWPGRFGLLSVWIGRFGLEEGAEGEPGLLEVSSLIPVGGAEGRAMLTLSRLVDGGGQGELRGLAHRRPRELAYMQLVAEPGRWSLAVRWRAASEGLTVEAEPILWWNLLGAGRVLGRLMTVPGARVPVAGGLVSPRVDGGTQARLMRLKGVQLPERVHRGLLTEEELRTPLLVMAVNSLRCEV